MSGRVAVTGATGFIGWHVCERLRDEGWTVTAVVRPEGHKALPDGIARLPAALEPGALRRAFSGADAVVHAAGITRARSTAEYRRVNVETTRAVADAARLCDAHLVHVSSLTAAGPASPEHPRTEADPSGPITPYGTSKLEAETVIRGADGLRWTMVRPAAVYGPRDRQFLPLFRAGRRGVFLRPPNAGAFFLTLAYVDDVARAIAMVCGNSAVHGETLFLGDDAPVSIDDLLRTVAATFNRRFRPLTVPFAAVRLGASLGAGGLSGERLRELRSDGFVCSVARAAQLIHFRTAVDLMTGFGRTAAWYAENGWL